MKMGGRCAGTRLRRVKRERHREREGVLAAIGAFSSFSTSRRLVLLLIATLATESTGSICASRSRALGVTTTSATVGTMGSFTIEAKDEYGQQETEGTEAFVVGFSRNAGSHEPSTHSFSVQTLVQPGTIHGVTITAGGSSCTADGTLSATVAAGQSGAGFAASFTQAGGAIATVTVTAEGDGYTATPTLVIASGGTGCTGYTLTPEITLLGEHYGTFYLTVSGSYSVTPALLRGKGLRASYFSNMWLSGTPDVSRVDDKIDFDWGTGGVTDRTADRASARWEGVLLAPGGGSSGSIPRGGIHKIIVFKSGSGCTDTTGTLTATGGGGTGFAASFDCGTTYDQEGNLVQGIVKVTVTCMGAGYTTQPSLVVTSGGAGCAGYKLFAHLQSMQGLQTVFGVHTDGSVRLWVDNRLIIDQWMERAPSLVSLPQGMCASPGATECPPGSRTCIAGEVSIHSLAVSNGGFRLVTTNACPGHAWAPTRTLFKPMSQIIVASIPSSPTISSYPTSVLPVNNGPAHAGVIGYAKDGVPFYGPDEAAVAEGVLDSCGGHADDDRGVYHYHVDPACSYQSVQGRHSPLIGFMLDGVPLYGLQDVGGAAPLLDECGGHVDEEHPFYHYHTSKAYPYTVSCLKGCIAKETAAGFGVKLTATPTCIAGARQYSYSSLDRTRWSAGDAMALAKRQAVNKTYSYAGTMALLPGSIYPIKMEYRHHIGPASVKLVWAPGLGQQTVVEAFKWTSSVTACGDLPEVPCGSQANLTVQPGPVVAAACTITPVANMILNTSGIAGPVATTMVFDPLYGTFGLGWSPKFRTPNYVTRAGAFMFLVDGKDEFSNARAGGGDVFTVKALRKVLAGRVEWGGTDYVQFDSRASKQDEAYLGMYVDIVRGSGLDQRALITRYKGSTQTAQVTFAIEPDHFSFYQVGPLASFTVTDMKNGSYSVLAELSVSGNYTMWVETGGVHVSGSPFHVHLVPAPFDPRGSLLDVPLVWTAGEPSSFVIVPRDAYGNNVSSSDAFPAYADTCTDDCAAVRFSAMVKSTAAVSKVSVGSIAAAGTASDFTLGSTASLDQGTYVGMAINIGGFTRNITHHGAAASSSAAAGRVITVSPAFESPPSVGDAYYVTKFSSLVPTTKRVCKMSTLADGAYSGTCPALMQTGEYTLEVASAVRAVNESPRKFVVHPSWKCGSQSYAFGAGLTLATVAAAASFTIATRDSFGQVTTRGGDVWTVAADRPGSGVAAFADRDTGTYAVTFTPTRSGRYQRSVKLGGLIKIINAPHDLFVKAGTLCATMSRAYGSGLTAAAMGVQTRFTVMARDAYSNDVDFLDDSSVTCATGGAAGACMLTVTVGTQVETRRTRGGGYSKSVLGIVPGWDVAYQIDRAFATESVKTTLAINGEFVGNIEQGGLFATYYNGDILQVPITAGYEANIDFQGTGFGGEEYKNAWPWQGDVHRSLQATGTCLVSGDNFAVRWKGFLSGPVENVQYTFLNIMVGNSERIRLWVDNSLIIDQWTSIKWRSPTGTYIFRKGRDMYDFQLDYKKGSDVVNRRSSLFWSNPTHIVPSIIPSERFFRRRLDFTTLVGISSSEETHAMAAFGLTDATKTLATGNGLSMATAGGPAYVTITAKDSFGTQLRISAGEAFSFTARAGKTPGGLFATFYSDVAMSSPSTTRIEPNINFAGGSTTLAKALRVPTPADPARVLQLTNAAALGTAVGSNIVIGNEVMTVVSINLDEVTVARGKVGTALASHALLAPVQTVVTGTLPKAVGYSVRWAGLARPQYAGEYTWYAGVVQNDERVKLWLDGKLMVDQWSSIAATEVSATWDSRYAGGYSDIKIEYRNPAGIDGVTLSWEHASQAKAVVTSERLFSGSSMLNRPVKDIKDGTYRVMHVMTHSAQYQTFVALHRAGGLQATYYSDVNCYHYTYGNFTRTVDFDWGVLAPHGSIPADNYCVRWAGWVKPEYTGVYTFGVRADDAAQLYVNNELLIDEKIDGDVVEWGATISLEADILYPIKLEYQEYQGRASAMLRWSTEQMPTTSISEIEYYSQRCQAKYNALPHPQGAQDFSCLAISGHDASGGMWFLDGDFEIKGAKGRNARGTFTVNHQGSLNGFTFSEKGTAYSSEPHPRNVSIYYPGTTELQDGTVTSVVVEVAGTNYVNGKFKITGSTEQNDAYGQMLVTSTGAVSSVTFSSHGSGYYSAIFAQNVFLVYDTTDEPMGGSVTSITLSGTMTSAYTENSDGTVTCTNPCTGAGLAFKCAVRGGSVDQIIIVAHGTGYTQANPPTVACPGGAGQTFTPKIAGGAVISPRVAVGAWLQPRLAGGGEQVIPSSRLYVQTEPITGWAGTSDFQVLNVEARALCASASTVSYSGLGWAPGEATVGNPVSFTIQARDQYGNICTGPDGTTTSPDDFFIGSLEGNDLEILVDQTTGITATAGITGQYTFALSAAQHTKAGYRQMHARLAIQGGLFATYYSGADYFFPVDPWSWPADGVPASIITSQTIDFSQAANTDTTVSQTWPTAPACLVTPIYPFKARWGGFWKQTTGTAAYTFSLATISAEERVRMWISNQLVIDQWTSIASLTPAAPPATYTVNVPYTIVVQYKIRRGGARRIKLLSATGGGAATLVPSGQLFRAYDLIWPGPVAGSSHNANATFLQTCAANSLLRGVTFTLATASAQASFTITARDAYGNLRGGRDDDIRVSIVKTGLPAVHASIAIGEIDGTYVASYRLTSSGSHTLSIATPLSGGLHATYFSTDSFTDARYIRVDTMAPMYGTGDASSQADWPGDVNQALDGSAFSVRWEGFVKPQITGTYQWTTEIGDADNRVKLWIENSIIIEQWVSLDVANLATGTFFVDRANTYYDIKLDYKEVAGGAQGMGLKWALAPTTEIIIDDRGCSSGCLGTTAAVVTYGEWLQVGGSGLGSTISTDGNAFKGTKFFTYSYPEAFGVYNLYEYHPASGTFSSAAPVNITHSTGTSTYYIDQTADGSAYNKVGRFCFRAPATVVFGTSGTTATVVADAIKLERTALSTEKVLNCGNFATYVDKGRIFLLDKAASSVANKYVNKFLTIAGQRREIFSYSAKRQVQVDRVFALGTTTLSSAVTAAATTVTFTDAAAAGIIVGRQVEIDYEIIFIAADLGGGSFTVVRGQHDTKAMSHVILSEVRTVLKSGNVAEAGVISASSAANKVTLATSAPTTVTVGGNNVVGDIFVGSIITISFEFGTETRTITDYTSGRVATVNPPFTQSLVAGASSYSIVLQNAYAVTEESLRAEDGSVCTLCPVNPSLLYSAPRKSINGGLSLSIGVERLLSASGPEFTIATAGVAATFTVTVQDIYGSALPYDAETVVFANLTLLTSTFGYGTIQLSSGLVQTIGDAYTFTLDEAAPSVADEYLGFLLTIGTETRSIVSYTAGRVVNVNVPFSSAPTTTTPWTVSAEEAGHEWFPTSASFTATTSVANPATVSYTATAAGMYRLEVNAHRVGGLQGNYYHNIYLQGQPSQTRVDKTVSFSWGHGLITRTAKSFVGVRWTGLIRPVYTQTYTFVTNATELGPRLVVAGTTLVDELGTERGCREWDPKRNCLWHAKSWKSTWGTAHRGFQGAYHATLALIAGQYYDIILDYRHRTGSASVELMWKSTTQRLQVIPSDRLYYPFQSVTGSPISLKVIPSPTFCSETTTYTTDHGLRCTLCGSAGNIMGTGLTMATAGVAATFNLQIKDQYGNVQTTSTAMAFASVESDASCGAAGTGRKRSGNCTATVAVTPTVVQVGGLNKFTYTTNVGSGDTKISAGVLTVGGLFATYYTVCDEYFYLLPKKASGVRAINITSMGSGCTADGTLSAHGGGSGAAAFRFYATFRNRGGSIANIIIHDAGVEFSEPPMITCCQQVYAVTIGGTMTGAYTNGGALGVSCTGGCTGSGLAGTCTSVAGVVTAITLTVKGYGYNAANAPTLTCAGGTGQTFTPLIDTSTGGTGCVGMTLTPVMQFTSNGETWADAEEQVLNDWWAGDLSAAGGTYVGCTEAVPYRVRVDSTVDFSADVVWPSFAVSTWPGTANSVQKGDEFQVRWAGFVKPGGTGEYTFTTKIRGVEERVKMWIDNSILIDQWTSLAATSMSATYNLGSTTFFPISVEYIDYVSDHQVKLQWEGAGDGPGVIASTALYAAYHAVGSPAILSVYPSSPCSTLSTLRGNGLTLSTAGSQAWFTLIAKDAFGNTRQTYHDEAKGYMYASTLTLSSSLKTVQPTLIDPGDGHLIYSFNVTRAGAVTLNAFVAKAGGLHATYFDANDVTTSSRYIREDATIDWSGTGDASSTTQWPGAAGEAVGGSTFSVKWTGFLRAPYANVYTFTAKLEQAELALSVGERVRMWIDNQLVINMWDSQTLRSPTGTFYFEKREFLYDIAVDYQHTSGTQSITLFWQSDGGSHAAVACDFSVPIAQPPTNKFYLSAYFVDMCGWNVRSSCDSGASVCALSQQKTSSGDVQFETLTGAPAFGTSVAWCGDMDGDGVEDLVVGAPGDDTTGTNSGAIYILLLDTSGALKTSNLAAGVSYRKICDNNYFAGCTSCLAASDLFGSHVAVMPSKNADGLRNILVASLGKIWWLYVAPDKTSPCVYCPPTVTSKVQLDVTGTIGSIVPTALAVWMDTEGDGVPDIIIGNSGASDGAIYVLGLTSTGCTGGAAICLSGTSTTIAHSLGGFTHSCTGGSCAFGSSISAIGDVNGDSVPDLAVGAPADNCGGTDRGAVWVLIMYNTGVDSYVKICSGTAGMPSSMISVNGCRFGSSVSGAGDINGDGVPDIVVGSPYEVAGANSKGGIYFISLTSKGTVEEAKLWGGPSNYRITQANAQSIGYSLAVKEDFNRDGMGPDIVSGQPLEGSGLGTVSVLLSAGWRKWTSGGNPVGGTPTASTGPATALSGSYTTYSKGKRCNDGTLYTGLAGTSINGEYSYLFSGTDASCATRCSNDALCNFYTTGTSNFCETSRSCRREDTATDTTTVTYQKDSFLFLDSQYIGDNADAGETYFTSPAGLWTDMTFWYHMYGAATGSLHVQARSTFDSVISGLIAAVAVDVDGVVTITLDSNAPAVYGQFVGYYISVGTQARKITTYSETRALLFSGLFLTTPTTSDIYHIRRLHGTCSQPEGCGADTFWTDVWSKSGQQQTSETDGWYQAIASPTGMVRPLQIRFKGVRGTGAATSDIAIDRISITQPDTILSTTSAVPKTRRLSKQIVPSTRLYMGLHAAGSPFTLYVRPDITDIYTSLCASTGCDAVQTLSAAATETVSVILKDIYGNMRTAVAAVDGSIPGVMYNALHEDGLVVYLKSNTDPNVRLYATVSLNSGSQYDATFTPSGLDETATQRKFASSSLFVQLSKVGGLNATYFRGTDLTRAVYQRLEKTVDFSCVSEPVGTVGVPPDWWSVRWRGLVRAPAADETVTFRSTTTSSPHGGRGTEGVRLWVTGFNTGDESLLIDRWEGRDTTYEATLFMQSDRLYDIIVEYRDTYHTSLMRLEWKSTSLGGSYAVIPSDRLYHDNSNHFASPFAVTTTA